MLALSTARCAANTGDKESHRKGSYMSELSNDEVSNDEGPKTLTGAEIIWETLVREGIEVVFGYPGGAIMPAYVASRGRRQIPSCVWVTF